MWEEWYIGMMREVACAGVDTVLGVRAALSPEFRELMQEMNSRLRCEEEDCAETQGQEAAEEESG